MADARPGAVPTNCNCMALRRAARRISHLYDAKLAEAGLTTAQYSILGALVRIGSGSVNALADAVELDRTTTGKNIRVLQRDGVVKIGASKEDGRARSISMTAKGHQMYLEAMPLWEAAQDEFEQSHGRANSAELRKTLDTLGRDTA